MRTFTVVDLSNLFHRARHGAHADPEAKAGLALLIVFRSLRKLHREFKTDHVVFAADCGSWRYELYPGYKAQRRLKRQAATVSEQQTNAVFAKALADLIDYLGEHTRCTVLQSEAVEGDDFIARWVQRRPDAQHIILSSDSDVVQLITGNVRVYDAINQRMIGIDSVVDEHAQKRAFAVSPKDGKLKVGAPDPGFVAEPEWWRKGLFIKLLRGDTGDSIFAAYPGARYEGKKCSIQAAWADRRERGYDWNNLMLQSWVKLRGVDALGGPLTETVRVLDEYNINRGLIDLCCQPPAVVARMDAAIDAALARPPPRHVGAGFLRFCAVHDLPALAKEAADHVTYLNASFPKESQQC